MTVSPYKSGFLNILYNINGEDTEHINNDAKTVQTDTNEGLGPVSGSNRRSPLLMTLGTAFPSPMLRLLH